MIRPEPSDPCAAADAALQRFLDGAAEPDAPALQRHWRDCRDCRERFAAARRLRDALARRPVLPEPSALLTERLVVAVIRDSRRRDRRRWLAGAALAAAGLLAVGVTWPRQQPGRDVPPPSPPPVPADWAEAFEPAAQSLGAARAGLIDGLEPVTTSARRAARLFGRDLPLAP